MKLYMKAAVITALVGLILTGLFFVWKGKTEALTPPRIMKIDQMEREGLPDFSLEDLSGKNFKLSDFSGQVVIVSFWASWCSPCLEEFPSMVELVQKLNGRLKLIAISQDSERDEIVAFLKAFPEAKSEDVIILWDKEHKVAEAYSAEKLPESFVADKNHRLVRKIVGSINWSTQEAVEFMSKLTDSTK